MNKQEKAQSGFLPGGRRKSGGFERERDMRNLGDHIHQGFDVQEVKHHYRKSVSPDKKSVFDAKGVFFQNSLSKPIVSEIKDRVRAEYDIYPPTIKSALELLEQKKYDVAFYYFAANLEKWEIIEIIDRCLISVESARCLAEYVYCFDSQYHQYIADRLIALGEDGVHAYILYSVKFEGVEHDDLLWGIIEQYGYEFLRKMFRRVTVSSYFLRQVFETIDDCGFDIVEREIKNPHYTVLVKEAVSDERVVPSFTFTLDVCFIDKGGGEVRMSEWLPTKYWRFVIGGTAMCDSDEKYVRCGDLSSRYSLFVLFHEIGHAHDLLTLDYTDVHIPGKSSLVAYSYGGLKEGVRRERVAWAWAIRQMRKIERTGFAIALSAEDLKNCAYTALNTYNHNQGEGLSEKGKEYTKGKYFEEKEEMF